MGIYNKDGKWWIDYYYKSTRVRECIGTSKTKAKDSLARRIAEIREDRYTFKIKKESPKFKDFAQFYLNTYSVNKRSHRREKDIMTHLVKAFGPARLSQIIPSMVEGYKADRARMVAKSTVNRELALLRHMFYVALEDGKIGSNPAKGGKKGIKHFKIEGQEERILSQEEVQRLLDASALHLRPIILTALNTAMRLREILYLKWDDVDLDYRVITVRHTKSAKERKVPVNTLLLETLKTQRAKARGEWVFPCPGTDKPMDGIKTAWQGALRRAGIEHCRFHDLRHTSATYMVLNGVDLATVKEILGHSDIRLTMRYTHPTSRAKRDAVETLTWNMPQYVSQSVIPRLDTGVYIKTGHRMDTKGVCTDGNKS